MLRRTLGARMARPPSSIATAPNKVTVVFSSLTERTSWPLWKITQLQHAAAPLDVSILAFTHAHGAIQARITRTSAAVKPRLEMTQVLPPNPVVGHNSRFCSETLETFLRTSFDPSRPNYFVYGGHGMGDYLDIEEGHTILQVHELAEMMKGQRYEGMVFDACCMANLDNVYHLRNNTSFIGACQGYLWEDDTSLDAHVLNCRTLATLSSPQSAGTEGTFRCLKSIESEFMRTTSQGDFAVLDPTHVEALYDFAMLEMVPRLYANGWTLPFHALQNPSLPTHIATKTELSEFVHFHHSFFPSNPEDRHLIDLKSCLDDMLSQESIHHHQGRRIAPSGLEKALELCRGIVRSYSPPKDPTTYALPMGGLSFAAHEVSTYSSLVVPRHIGMHYQPGMYTRSLLHSVNSVLAQRPHAAVVRSDAQPPLRLHWQYPSGGE